MAPALKALLSERHLHEYLEFTAEYRRIARNLELPRSADPPTKATYYHWLSGQLQGLPRGYHCLVLEHMFPGWSAQDLFARDGAGHISGTAGGLLAPIAPAVDPTALAGLWCTSYIYSGAHHVDLTTMVATNGSLTARNYPPSPRTEDHAVGWTNDITCSLSGRHLIGLWRNESDRYYYGAIHLAVLPGESILDGHYTSVLTDTRVEAGRWRWIRVNRESVTGVDISTLTLADPRRLHETIMTYSDYGPPIPIEEVTQSQ